MKAIKIVFHLFFFLSAISLLGEEQERPLLLPVGDKELKDMTMEISSGQVYSAQEGTPVSFEEMVQEMAECHFIYVGETHSSIATHEIQFKVIQALHRRDKNLIIGLEMLPVSCQETLNKWILGIINLKEFIREVKWYVHWNFNFAFYEPIFQFAKENRIPLYALNAPRDLIHKIRIEGWQSLSEDEKQMIPQPDLSNSEHRQLIRAILENTALPPQMKGKGMEMAFEGLYRAQSAWDEVMAYNADRAVKREGKRMIALAGSGHLYYNLGINRRSFQRNHLPFTTLVCVEVPEEKQEIRISRSLSHFVWGIQEKKKPVYPSVGLRLKKVKGLNNLVLGEDPIEGVAKYNDFQKGDVILSVQGRPFFEINELRMYLSRFRWGDEINFHVLRKGEEIDITMKFLYK